MSIEIGFIFEKVLNPDQDIVFLDEEDKETYRKYADQIKNIWVVSWFVDKIDYENHYVAILQKGGSYIWIKETYPLITVVEYQSGNTLTTENKKELERAIGWSSNDTTGMFGPEKEEIEKMEVMNIKNFPKTNRAVAYPSGVTKGFKYYEDEPASEEQQLEHFMQDRGPEYIKEKWDIVEGN